MSAFKCMPRRIQIPGRIKKKKNGKNSNFSKQFGRILHRLPRHSINKITLKFNALPKSISIFYRLRRISIEWPV